MSDLSAELSALLGGDTLTKTLSELITIVRLRGDFRNTKRFSDDMITVEIQAAFTEFYEFVVDTNEGYYDTKANVTTTNAVDFVALPSDTWRIRGVDRLDGADFIEMRLIGIHDRNRFGSTPGEPFAYLPTARGIDLYPTPNATYTLRVTYTPTAPILDSVGRSYYNGWEEYTVYGALVRLALNEERDASEWQRQLDFQRARITRGATNRRAQGPEYLKLHEGCTGLDDPHPWWSW